MPIKKLFKNSSFTIAEKFITALVQFISIPVLLKAYGKDNYGLIAIATSLNIFLTILNFGLPMGFPKFIAEWIAGKKTEELYSSSGTILSFYLIIGLVNFVLLLIVAWGFISVFKVTPEQMPMLRNLMVVTAFAALLSMPANYLDQILTGAQDLGYVSLMQVAKNGIYILLIVYIYFYPQEISLLSYYILQNLLMLSMVLFKIRRWRSVGSYRIFLPQWHLRSTVPVLKYCLALMTFSIFIVLDNASKPLIIGIMATDDVSRQMTDFQIISTFRMFLMLLATSVMQALIPYMSHQRVVEGDQIFKKIITQGTKIIWAIGALIGFLIILQAKNIVILYVGKESQYLTPLIVVYVVATMYNLYVTGIAAAILTSGKVTPMVWTTFAGFVVSTIISLTLIKSWQMKAIIYSLAGYNAVHFAVMHFFYLPTQFRINPFQQIFRVAAPPLIAGIVMYWLTQYVIKLMMINTIYWEITAGSVVGASIYLSVIFSIYIRPKETRDWIIHAFTGRIRFSSK
jgi:O-antigen/teichoic acid export membrane protein